MLSISIVVYKQDIGIFKRTLESIYLRLIEDINIQEKTSIIIIDNGNQKTKLEDAVNSYREKHLKIEIISPKKNLGYGSGHNIAIMKSNSDYHLVLNPDVILQKYSLKYGLEYLDSNPQAISVCPKCHDKENKPQYIAKKYPSIFDLFLRGLMPEFIKRYFNKRLSAYEVREITNADKVSEIELMGGCFMLCRTEALKNINGFDERYFLYFEDFALSIELGKLGKLIYLPSMSIIHFGGQTARKGILHIFLFLSSGLKFFNQYGWKII